MSWQGSSVFFAERPLPNLEHLPFEWSDLNFGPPGNCCSIYLWWRQQSLTRISGTSISVFRSWCHCKWIQYLWIHVGFSSYSLPVVYHVRKITRSVHGCSGLMCRSIDFVSNQWDWSIEFGAFAFPSCNPITGTTIATYILSELPCCSQWNKNSSQYHIEPRMEPLLVLSMYSCPLTAFSPKLIRNTSLTRLERSLRAVCHALRIS